MTREEAIEELKGCIIAEERGKDGKLNGNITCELTKDTLDMAIKALGQEPTTKNDLGVDVLDKIRAEIKHHSEHFINDDGDDCLAVYEDDVFEILDKYKAETEADNGTLFDKTNGR